MKRKLFAWILILCMTAVLLPALVRAADAASDGYYLIGSMNEWSVDNLTDAYRFAANPADADEYLLDTDLNEGDTLKVVKVEGGAITVWYPDGTGNDYAVDAAHAGSVTIYFRPTYKEDWEAFGGYIWIEAGQSGNWCTVTLTQPEHCTSCSLSATRVQEGGTVYLDIVPETGYMLAYFSGNLITEKISDNRWAITVYYDVTVRPVVDLVPGYYYAPVGETAAPAHKFREKASRYGSFEREATLTEGEDLYIRYIFMNGTAWSHGGNTAAHVVTANEAGDVRIFVKRSESAIENYEADGYFLVQDLFRWEHGTKILYEESVAIIKQFHPITVVTNGHGTVNVIDQAVEGDIVAFRTVPNEGYVLDTIAAEDGAGNPIDLSYNVFDMPDSSVTITASFREETPAALSDGYYVFKNGETVADVTQDCALVLNGDGASGFYRFRQKNLLAAGDEIHVVRIEDGAIVQHYPRADYWMTVQTYNLDDEVYGTEVNFQPGGFAQGYSENGRVYSEGRAFYLPIIGGVDSFPDSARYAVGVQSAQGGAVTVPETAYAGQRITLTPVPAEGYRFVSLSVADAAGTAVPFDAAVSSFLMPASDVTVTPVFEPAVYDVWINGTQLNYETRTGEGYAYDPQTGTLTLDHLTLNTANDFAFIHAACSLTVKGSASFRADTSTIGIFTTDCLTFDCDAIEITNGDAPAISCYRTLTFARGTVNANSSSANNAVTADTIVIEGGALTVANDAGGYSRVIGAVHGLTVRGGTLHATGVRPVEAGFVDAANNPGCIVLENGETIRIPENGKLSADGKKVTDADGADVTEVLITQALTITVEDSENGAVASDKETAAAGETVTLTVVPTAGYTLDSLTVTYTNAENETVTIFPTRDPADETRFTFLMPRYDVTVRASFMAPHTLTYEPIDAVFGYWDPTNFTEATGGDEFEIALYLAPGAYEAGYRLLKVLLTEEDGTVTEITRAYDTVPFAEGGGLFGTGTEYGIGIYLHMPPSNVTVTAVWALPGDVNCDGRITSADAALLLRASVNLVTLSAQSARNAEVDGVEGLTAGDAAAILRYVVRLIDRLPVA